MSKDIKDYLHLYLGCEIVYQGGIGFHILDEYRLSKIFAAKNFERWKPILRPLSDMSEEEKNVYQKMQPDNGIENRDPYQPHINLNAKRTLWALSKHFDLFNLIPEYAIDRTTLNNPRS